MDSCTTISVLQWGWAFCDKQKWVPERAVTLRRIPWELLQENSYDIMLFCHLTWLILVFYIKSDIVLRLSLWYFFFMQGGAKVGLWLWICESLLYYYLLIIVLFSIRTTVNPLLPHSVFIVCDREGYEGEIMGRFSWVIFIMREAVANSFIHTK